MSARLERNPNNKVIAGVCSGLAEYLQIDVGIMRVIFVIATLLWGFGLLAYIVLLIVMPLPGRTAPANDLGIAGDDLNKTISNAGERIQNAIGPDADTDKRRQFAGWLLVGLGVLFLMSNTGLFRGLEGRLLWPLAVIALGVWLVVRRTR